MIRRRAGHGWRPDHPDQRDHRFAAPYGVMRALPRTVDLRPGFAPPDDQGAAATCVANQAADCYRYDLRRQGAADFAPSRLFVYYTARAYEGPVLGDTGVEIRDAVRSLAAQGVCTEQCWPYDLTTLDTQPAPSCYQQATQHTITRYQRVVQNLTDLKAALASGSPVLCGLTTYQSFESDQVAATGAIPLPGTGESVVGGHCMTLCGYDDDAGIAGAPNMFVVRNSYGAAWGAGGYGFVPYAYVIDRALAQDFWVLSTVSG